MSPLRGEQRASLLLLVALTVIIMIFRHHRVFLYMDRVSRQEMQQRSALLARRGDIYDACRRLHQSSRTTVHVWVDPRNAHKTPTITTAMIPQITRNACAVIIIGMQT